MTLKLPLTLLPLLSVAVHVTGVVPMGKALPETGEQFTTGLGSVLSVAETSKVTCAPSAVVALTMMSSGSSSIGSVVSAVVGPNLGNRREPGYW